LISETEFDRCEGPDCQLYTVAAAGSTLIAAGWDASGLGAWTSADGTEWSKTVFDPDEIIPVHGMDPEVPGEADFEHLLAFDGSVFAFGNATLFGYEDDELVDWWSSGAVWKTSDGISWTRADTEGSFGDGETWFSDITVWDDRIYIIGEECDLDWSCRHGLWSSSNGSDWAHYRFEDELESIIPQNISGARDSLIVTGVLNNLPVAVTTLDVHTWQLHDLTTSNLFGVSVPTNDLIQHNDQLIAINRDQINTWQP
jgi:hypothetical protein